MKIGLPLILLVSGVCCMNKSKQWTPGSGPNTSMYTKIEIYCWCFYNSALIKNNNGTFSGGTNSDCSTTRAIRPDELIRSERFLDSTTNSSMIMRLQQAIYDRNENAKLTSDGIDSRFLILFWQDKSTADTFVCDGADRFLYNGKYELSYSYPVIDSIRSILGKDKIYCKFH